MSPSRIDFTSMCVVTLTAANVPASSCTVVMCGVALDELAVGRHRLAAVLRGRRRRLTGHQVEARVADVDDLRPGARRLLGVGDRPPLGVELAAAVDDERGQQQDRQRDDHRERGDRASLVARALIGTPGSGPGGW